MIDESVLFWASVAIAFLAGWTWGRQLFRVVQSAVRPRWEVRVIESDGTIMERKRFWIRRRAQGWADFIGGWGDGTLAGVELPPEVPPLYTTEVVRRG